MLEKIALFDKLADTTLQLLEQQLRMRRLEKDATLFSPGDLADSMYVVKSGRVRIWTVSAAGQEITLNVLEPGAVFGEIGLLDGSERTAGASALDAADLLAISRRTFDDALDRDPQLARNAIALLCERLRWVSARMEDLALRNAPERLARIMVHLCNDHGVECPEGLELSVRLTQGELARWAHMSRETLNKIIHRWSDEGLLLLSPGKITVRDEKRLLEIAESGNDE
jgi:CRP-like cAMP-binding protein